MKKNPLITITNVSKNGSDKKVIKNGSGKQSPVKRCPFCNLPPAPADVMTIMVVRFSESTDQIVFHLGCSPTSGVLLTKEQLLEFKTISEGKALGPLYLTDHEYDDLNRMIENIQEEIEEKDNKKVERIRELRCTRIFKLLMQLKKSRVKESEILAILLRKFTKSGEILGTINGLPIVEAESEIIRLKLPILYQSGEVSQEKGMSAMAATV